MQFSLDVLRARKGDCLILHYGAEDKPRLIIIDGGPSDVYQPQLKPRIAAIHKARGLDEQEPLPVEAVMVSHVDDDHIKGILELTKEQREEPDLRLAVTSLWHNSFDDLLTTRPAELQASVGIGAAGLGGGRGGQGANDVGKVLAGFGAAALDPAFEAESDEELDAARVLASIPQGRQLRDDAVVLGWKPNHRFKGKLILASEGAKPVTVDGELKLTVIGPMQAELQALQEAHDKWLRDKQKKTTKSTLAAFVDGSVANLSSIVMLAELGGKRMLLTGDARGDKILEGMELMGLLDAGAGMHLDVLKVPHHGSDNNMETSFFRRVTADHYVFSGDGEHGNPERKTLEMLFEARPNEAFTIHLTYPITKIDERRKGEWEKQQAKEKARKVRKADTVVREDWSDAKHGLQTLLDAQRIPGQEVVIVGGGKPHVIDLLDPINF
jgi:hypothetical protein